MIKKIIPLITALAILLTATLSVAAPKIEHWTTEQGLRVYYVSVPQIPMLDARLTFAAGGVRDEKTAGVSKMTSAILHEGAAGLNADQLAEKFDSVGAETGAGTARDMAWITLRTITLEKEQKIAVDSWLKVIGKPDFPEKSFNRLKKQFLLGLQAEKQSPSAIATKTFYKNLYGDHPYASPTNGTEESIEAMTLDNLKAFYKKYYVANNGILAIVGSVDRKQAEVLANRVASELELGKPAAEISKPQPLTAEKTIRIPYPSQQAHVMIGQLGNKRGDKDYFSLYLGNHVLGGGGFTARLMKEIRDERGLSYSVYSYFSPMQELGPFTLGLQTKIAQTDEAVSVAADLIKTFQQAGPTEKEVIAAKKDITGSFPLNVASNADIIGYINMIGFYNLPLDYLDTFTTTIDKITRDEVSDAFKRRLQPEKMLTVIVGGEAKPDKKQVDSKKPEEKGDGKKEEVKPVAAE